MKKQNLKFSICCTLLLCSIYAFVQPKFKYKTAVSPVNAAGFYSIDLHPDVMAKTQATMADIRLTDEHNTPVPYLLGGSLPLKAQTHYVQLPPVKQIQPDSVTSYVVQNKAGASINQLWIELRNTAVTRSVNILGSDDLHNWFAVQEGLELDPQNWSNAGTFEQLVNFPASTYRYLKIQVNDKNRIPIHILSAGIYIDQPLAPQYETVPAARFIQRNSTDTSYIDVNFAERYRINKLQIQFGGPRFYKRTVQVYQYTGSNNKELLASLVVSAADSGQIHLNALAGRLLLVVLNEDNPPLIVQKVTAYQLKQTLIAYFEPKHQYSLLFGNQQMAAPRFDLQFFADSITRELTPVTYAPIQTIATAPAKVVKSKQGIPSWLVWVAGGVALLMLLLLTLRMTKEINQRKNEE